MKVNRKISTSEIKKVNSISRRQAMNKLGLAAFSTATMLLLLNKPEKVQAQDTSGMPGDPGDF
jgi:hypothetical protein